MKTLIKKIAFIMMIVVAFSMPVFFNATTKAYAAGDPPIYWGIDSNYVLRVSSTNTLTSAQKVNGSGNGEWNWSFGVDPVKKEKIKSVIVVNSVTVPKYFGSCLFDNFASCTSMDLKNLDTSQVEKMNSMFDCCKSLTYLDISNFNTSKVTSMSFMFNYCSNLKTIKINPDKFNTSKVTDMSWMFDDCTSLTAIDISKFNTSKVEDFKGMFGDCDSITSLDLRNFNTSNATGLSFMFSGMDSLKSINVSSFNTGKVVDFQGMFSGCKSLESLDISNFNVANAKDDRISSMLNFGYSNSMRELTLPTALSTRLSDSVKVALPNTSNKWDGKWYVKNPSEVIRGYKAEGYSTSAEMGAITPSGKKITFIPKLQRFTVSYRWNGYYYPDVAVPASPNPIEYGSKYTIDTTYYKGLEIRGKKYGKEGTYVFDGWSESGVITIDSNKRINGSWTFREDPKEDTTNSGSNNTNTNTTSKPATGTSNGIYKGASEEVIDRCIKSGKEEPAGTVFRLLQAKSTKVAKNSITLTWAKVPGAAKYVVYGNKCGVKNKYLKLTTTTKRSITYKKILKANVAKGTYYKFVVVAYDKNNKAISTSKTVHVATKGGKVGNDKKVKTAAKKNKVSLKKGKTFKLKAKPVVQSKKLKVKRHRKMAYETSNSNVATVSSAGIVKAVGKGTCYVYAYTQNGVFAKIKVTVN